VQDTDAPHGMLPLLDDEDLDGPDAVSLTALYLCSVCPEGHADELLAAVQDTTCKVRRVFDHELAMRRAPLQALQRRAFQLRKLVASACVPRRTSMALDGPYG
jgi:hypothetical protein